MTQFLEEAVNLAIHFAVDRRGVTLISDLKDVPSSACMVIIQMLILGVIELDYLLKTGKKQISDSTDLQWYLLSYTYRCIKHVHMYTRWNSFAYTYTHV